MWITRLTASGSTRHVNSQYLGKGRKQRTKTDKGKMKRAIERETRGKNKVRQIGRQSLKKARRPKRFIRLSNTACPLSDHVRSSLYFIDKTHHSWFSPAKSED